MANKKAAMKQPISGKQATAVANFLKKGSAKAPAKAAAKTSATAPVDAEDLIDGGADENEE